VPPNHLAGIVIEAETGKPIVNAQVAILEAIRKVDTDSAGRFQIALPATGAKVVARWYGYEQQSM
jgi:hypothetical protein